MKKRLMVAVMGLSLLGLVACTADDGSNVSGTSMSSSLSAEQNPTAAYSNQRLAMDKVTYGQAANDFSGGTNLASLKGYFGEPTSSEQTPSGNVTLDTYTWQLGQVKIVANLFQDSTVSLSISNFYFTREETVTSKTYQKLSKGMTYAKVEELLGKPDDYARSVSSDGERMEALWVSGLRSKKANPRITLIFKNGVLDEITNENLSE